MPIRRILAFVGIVSLVSSCAFAQPNFKLKRVVVTGQPAPVPPELSFVSGLSLNNSGSIAFLGDGAVFVNSGGHNSIIAAFGDIAPGGGSFIDAGTPSLNSKGEVVFRGDVTSPGTSGIFLSSGGSMSQLVADGAIATSGDQIFPNLPVANATGDVVFTSFFVNGLFRLSHGTISRLVGPGDPAPGGQTFRSFSSPAINQSGQVVFSARLSNGRTGLFLDSNGSITKIVASGDVLPGGAVFFAVLGSPSLNDAGDVAFAGLSNGSVTGEGVFLFSSGSLQVVVPGFSPLPSGLDLFPTAASLGGDGQIAFLAQDLGTGSSANGVFQFSDGSVSQIMSSGGPSPEGDTFTGAFAVQINASGQIAFASRLTQHNDAIYLSSSGTTVRVAGQGDTIARQPRFQFPTAFGLSNSGEVLVFDQTFPGGIGLYDANSGRGPSTITLDAHVGQPFGSDGVIQGFFENFPMNAQGEVVFNSDLSGGTSGIFLKSGPNLTRIVRSSLSGDGDPAPNGGTFLGVGDSSISSSGANIGFSGFTASSAGIYVSSGGHITLAVDDNAPLPNDIGVFGTAVLDAINDQGQIAFFAQPFPSPNGIYVGSNGQFTLLARDGDPAPGGDFFSFPFPDPRYGPVINNAGDVAFAADLLNGGRAIFLYHQGAVTRIIGPGDASPDGSTFVTADAPTLNASGQIAFSGETFANGFGVFVSSGNGIKTVAVAGDRVSSHLTLTFADLPQINDGGNIALEAVLSDGTGAVLVAVPIGDDDDNASTILPERDSVADRSRETREWIKTEHPRNFSFEKRKD